MFNQLFIGIILVLSLGGYWLYSENQTLKANSIKLEAAVAEQKAAMAAIQESHEKQATPGLIEKTFNKGTAKVFEDIENDSKTISDLSSPSIPK